MIYMIHFFQVSKKFVMQAPDRIIQFGLPRTATTLQFQILCVLMSLLHDNNIKHFSCNYQNEPLTQYSITKYHYTKDFPESLRSDM